MLPPPGFEPTPISPFEDAVSTAIATSLLHLGVDMPSPIVSSIITVATQASSMASSPDPDNGECRLLGPFAIFVQGALGAAAILALVYKRWRERPQRPLKIWFFDVSKQVLGSVLVHIANLLMSMLSSGQFSVKITPEIVSGVVRRMVDADGKYSPNPCSFYLLNLAIDVSARSCSLGCSGC